jgi:hypothetical protein
MPAAIDTIMANLPPARAGVGSAVHDTVREFGGALGLAVIGSVAATSYATSMHRELDRFPNLTNTDRTMLTDNVGAAIQASRRVDPPVRASPRPDSAGYNIVAIQLAAVVRRRVLPKRVSTMGLAVSVAARFRPIV